MWLWPLFSLVWLTSVRQINDLFSKAACLFVRETAPAFKKRQSAGSSLVLLWPFLMLLQQSPCLLAVVQITGPGSCDFQVVGVYILSVTSASFEIFQLLMPHFLPASSAHNDQSSYAVPDVCGLLT